MAVERETEGLIQSILIDARGTDYAYTTLLCHSGSPIRNLFAWIDSGEIAIPEIQRPFVWDAVKVRKMLDSLFMDTCRISNAWRNPNVKLKVGTTSSGKRIIIDGQQRITALMAAILGFEVVNKDYKRVTHQDCISSDQTTIRSIEILPSKKMSHGCGI